MYYHPDYINWGPQGWVCPKCGRVMSPTQPYCLFCSQQGTIKYTETTSAKLEWIYKEDTVTTPITNDWSKIEQNCSIQVNNDALNNITAHNIKGD